MRVEILHVPDCPGVALLEQRLRHAPVGDLKVTYRVVEDLETAEALGMTGSPTLLIGGTDPFATPGLTASMSCRLYPDDNGRRASAPPADAIHQALAGQP